jgi:PII-like signaling protein
MSTGPEPINRLSSTDDFSASDLLVVYKSSQGEARTSALTNLQKYMQDNLVFSQSSFTTQYSSPLSGATVLISDGFNDDSNIHTLVTPAGTIAVLNMTLPLVSRVVDKQQVMINFTQDVTTLNIDLNGASSISGIKNTAPLGVSVTMKYDGLMSIWYVTSIW